VAQGTNIRTITKTAIVTSFTIAAGLIWRDVIIDVIELVVPPQDKIIFKLAAAILATVLVIVSLYIILKTEDEAEYLFKKYQKHYEKTTLPKKPKKRKK
jgi:hypothetical protein